MKKKQRMKALVTIVLVVLTVFIMGCPNVSKNYYGSGDSISDTTAPTITDVIINGKSVSHEGNVSISDNSAPLNVTINATDADDGGYLKSIRGYQITTSDKAPSSDWNASSTISHSVEKNDSIYIWALDYAGNVSAGFKVTAQ